MFAQTKNAMGPKDCNHCGLPGRYNSRQFVAFEGAAIPEVHVALTLIRFDVTAERAKHIADETKGLRAGMRQLSAGSC